MKVRRWVRLGVLPLIGYALAYVLLTFPLILQFNAAYFCDDGDGPQTIWDIWWVRHATLDLHQSIFFTPLLHWPVGASLWLHSLSPLTGLVGVPLSLVLNPVHTYNVLIIFCFASAALTAFWLAFDQTRAYWPSLAAGYIYSFCSLHFAHAPGHLHQTATEALPLLGLMLVRLLRQPDVWRAVWAALALTAVLLCDHYQFIYAAAIAFLFAALAAWRRWRKGETQATGHCGTMDANDPGQRASTRQIAIVTAAILIACGVTIGPMLFCMARDAREPQAGLHDPEQFSADLLSLFVPGRTWQYRELTRPVWQEIGKYSEKSVSIGVAALAAACVARSRKRFAPGRWWLVAGVFAVFALGPTLHIYAEPVWSIMPYRLLDWLPLFRLSGCPGRMMLGTQLAIAVLAAGGLARLGSAAVIRGSRLRTITAILFVLALVIETQPSVQATFPASAPPWTTALRDLPIRGAVIDLRLMDTSQQLYAQTLHGRPMAFGYLARVPIGTQAVDQQILKLLAEGHFTELATMGFGAVVDSPLSPPLPLKVMYVDGQAKIYQISAVDNCLTPSPS